MFLLFPFFMNAQSKKNYDSIIKEGTALMYENPDKAIALGNQIIKEAKDNTDIKIKTYKLISDAYSSKRDYEKSILYVNKASQILHLSNDKLLKIIIYNKMGIQYEQLKIYDKSLQYLDQSEQLILEYPSKDSIHYYLGVNYVVRGFIYKEKLNCDIAIDFFDKGISSLLKSKSKSPNSPISIAKYNKGNCHLQMLEYSKAKENFLDAIKFAKKANANSLHAFALKGLAEVSTKEGKHAEAINFLNNAKQISAQVNDLVLNKQLYKGLAENYLALNNWDNYKKFHNLYLSTQKLIKENERKSISESLKEKKSELNLKFKNSLPKFYLAYIAIFFTIILLVFAFLYFIKLKKKEISALQDQINTLQNLK
ncbi:tetratricopeptide repeat protein [Flavobacterium terrigena]|uniref:tetratricopeptide repeat protein n=1 Tax=Flavobacterium terrigena TaxID=402734 RepID=UPI001C434853|nr:hypothetical protein [Flavobacterium terrigena]